MFDRLAQDETFNPSLFLAPNGADNILLANDTFANGLNPQITRVTDLSDSGIQVDMTRLQLDGGLQFILDDSFASFDAGALDPNSFSSASDIVSLLTDASSVFGDYYFEYAVDVGGQTATGLMTVQVTPEVQLDAVTSVTVAEDNPILVSDLITSRTYGPGDRLILEGLPEGTRIYAQANADGDEGYTGVNLDITVADSSIAYIDTEWLLPWRFDDIEIVLPENYKTDFSFEMTLKAQYESASASAADSVLS